jgi:hypothetical protein
VIQQSFKELLSYIKSPNPFVKEDESKIFYNQLFPLVIISLGFAFLSVVFVNVLESLHLIKDLPDFDLLDLKEKKILLFLMVTILAPILEELIFRYQLRNHYLAILGYALLAIYFLYKIYSGLTLIICIAVISILVFLVINYFGNNPFRKHRLIEKIFPTHFYLTAICFGLVHISNYNHPFAYGFPIVLLVLPQMFLGFVLGYVRIRFGISKSIMMHAAYNLIPALALLAGY